MLGITLIGATLYAFEIPNWFAKVETIFNELRKKGIKGLSKVDAPIGISINSITPSEIAVSIMAKIIKVKNG